MKTGKGSRSWLAPGLFLLALLAVFVVLFRPRSPEFISEDRNPGLHSLTLQISDGNLRRLKAKRDEALRIGVLQTAEGDWVDGMLKDEAGEMPVKIRLKGDWPDHLRGEKWSYRVKIGEGRAWRGLKTFSLQNPESRNFLMEWLFHQFLHQEDILTTRYDFIHLQLNEQDLGIYALEEHFTSELLEAQHRIPGPLVKLSEAGVWEIRAAELTLGLEPACELPVFAAATVEAFGEDQVNEPIFHAQFLQAQSLLNQARFRLRPHRELFDLDRAAKRHAATDLFRAFHSLIWHNQRWYFNPITAKLEPLVYDGYPGTDLTMQFQGPFSGFQASGLHIDGRYSELMDAPFYTDELFLERYYFHLFRYSQPGQVEEFLDSLETDLKLRETFLQEEFFLFKFDREFLLNSARGIRNTLDGLETAVKEGKIRLRLLPSGREFWVCNELPFPVKMTSLQGESHFLHAFDPEFPCDSVQLDRKNIWSAEIPGTGKKALIGDGF